MLNFRLLFLYFEVGHLSGVLFHGFGSLQRLQGILSWIQFVDPETMKCDGATKRSICRVDSYVSPVSNIKTMDLQQETRPRDQNCAQCAENLLQSDARHGTGMLALPEPSVGRKNGLFRSIGMCKFIGPTVGYAQI
jgi:hypothetical protein